MSILVIEEAAEAAEWAQQLRAELPGAEIRVWPDVPDPEAVEMAVVWDDLDALAGLSNLSAVVVLGAGVDHLLGRLDAMPEGVTCLRIVDDSIRAQMVEWVLLALVTHTRRWDDYRAQQRAGSYEELPVPVPPDLVVGILGFGVLGRATGELLRDIGYRVRAWSGSAKRAEGIECFAGDEALGAFLSACDVVVCMLPLTTETEGLLATYAILLPISMDLGKYLPPMMAAQLGGMAGELLGGGDAGFAVPPIPEPAESIQWLRHVAELRGDDLVWAGDMSLDDIQAAMRLTTEAVHEYGLLHKRYLDGNPAPTADAPAPESAELGADVQHVLYQLMSDRDRLAELSRLVGQMRFGLESHDDAAIRIADASLGALAESLDARYWANRVRVAAQDPSDSATRLAQLYVERCYKLLDEDFSAVDALEKEIARLSGGAPPREDLRG